VISMCLLDVLTCHILHEPFSPLTFRAAPS
jgi:hypothetical protein